MPFREIAEIWTRFCNILKVVQDEVRYFQPQASVGNVLCQNYPADAVVGTNILLKDETAVRDNSPDLEALCCLHQQLCGFLCHVERLAVGVFHNDSHYIGRHIGEAADFHFWVVVEEFTVEIREDDSNKAARKGSSTIIQEEAVIHNSTKASF